MSDGTTVPARKKAPTWQLILLGTIFVAGIVSFVILLFDGEFKGITSHDGPTKMITVGINRFQSCKYAGDFLGGAGFDCIVKNVSSDEHRPGEQMYCAGFDSQNRMIRSSDHVADLYSSVLAPGEEHVVRIYLPKDATVSVCTDFGSLGSPAQLQKVMPDLRKDNLVQEIDI